jgi:hypothetical protein
MKNSKQASSTTAGLILCITQILCAIAVLIILLHQVKQTNKYYKLACVQSDIIRNYHDFCNTDIYNVAQDYLGILVWTLTLWKNIPIIIKT